MVSGFGEALPDEDRAKAIELPSIVYHVLPLPDNIEALYEQIQLEATRENLRRFHKTNFEVRTTQDKETIRTFQKDYHAAYSNAKHGGESRIQSFEGMYSYVEKGGELLCLYHDGEWIGGQFNTVSDGRYVLAWIGIRDGADVPSATITALYIKSMERAIERGLSELSLGISLPFLDDGIGRFKGLWGGNITREPYLRTTAHLFADARQKRVQRFLTEHPTIFCRGEDLFGIRWLEEGTRPLRHICRDANRFHSIKRWYVLAEPEVLNAAQGRLAEFENLTPVPINPLAQFPAWLCESIA